MHRRHALATVAAWAAAGSASLIPALAAATSQPTRRKPYSFDLTPPMGDAASFVAWMVKHRGEAPGPLAERYARFGRLVQNKDLWDARNQRAFLMTPREDFVLPRNHARAYEHAFLDIGFGVTISGPHLVGRMTSVIDVKLGEKVLEIGTGSGYQAAYLANLTDQVWTIEIIKPLAERTRGVYDGLIARGYTEFKAISSRNSDGYHGWAEAGPFDKIIVTCGIDHIPPPLLQQLKVGGTMVIPVGPPGAQRVLKVRKEQNAAGAITVARSDIYNGRIVPFVPFTKLDGEAIRGTHNR
ncbi:MAG: protein-L-isoaspartate O-methyltransferase [Rubrivivax sp.]|nr:protein-L-isoaspartate O-methyltransferase [Rubrivivax sp.]